MEQSGYPQRSREGYHRLIQRSAEKREERLDKRLLSISGNCARSKIEAKRRLSHKPNQSRDAAMRSPGGRQKRRVMARKS